jgi:acyl-CoA thioester hydrolase
MSEFAFELEMPIRFRDVDAMNHVNNAVYVTYLEQARVQYIQQVVGRDFMETGAVIASLEIDYRQPIDYAHDTVTVGVRATDMSTSTVQMEYELRTPDGLAATAETPLVTYDPAAGESVPLPDHWREAIREFEGL